MYVLGPELLYQTSFAGGVESDAWYLGDGAEYYGDGQITMVNPEDAEYALNSNYFDLEEGDYILSFDLFGSGSLRFTIREEGDPFGEFYASASVPLKRQSIIVSSDSLKYNCSITIAPDSGTRIGDIYGYRTINNISFKKIISVDHTVGSGHAKFFPPFALGSDLVSEWNMGLLDDPFDEESWVNNGGWVYTHSSTNNGYITHTPGNFNTMTVNLINPIYIGEWVRIYFEVGGTTGALQIDLGGGEIVLDLEEDLSHGQYPANSGHSPEGRGYIFYIQMASENNTLTLTPSSGFDGWVDNIFICPVMGI